MFIYIYWRLTIIWKLTILIIFSPPLIVIIVLFLCVAAEGHGLGVDLNQRTLRPPGSSEWTSLRLRELEGEHQQQRQR